MLDQSQYALLPSARVAQWLVGEKESEDKAFYPLLAVAQFIPYNHLMRDIDELFFAFVCLKCCRKKVLHLTVGWLY